MFRPPAAATASRRAVISFRSPLNSRACVSASTTSCASSSPARNWRRRCAATSRATSPPRRSAIDCIPTAWRNSATSARRRAPAPSDRAGPLRPCRSSWLDFALYDPCSITRASELANASPARVDLAATAAKTSAASPMLTALHVVQPMPLCAVLLCGRECCVVRAERCSRCALRRLLGAGNEARLSAVAVLCVVGFRGCGGTRCRPCPHRLADFAGS